jgi:hypothetical protein
MDTKKYKHELSRNMHSSYQSAKAFQSEKTFQSAKIWQSDKKNCSTPKEEI